MNAEAFIVQDFAAPSSPSPSPPPESSTPAAEDPEEGTVDPDDDIVPCESMLQLAHSAPPTSAAYQDTPIDHSLANNHYSQLMSLCSCDPPCDEDWLRRMARSFRGMTEPERVQFIRAMLFATAARKDAQNACLATSNTAARKRRSDTCSEGRTTIGYFVKGKRLCRPAFAAVLQLAEHTCQRHAKDVADSDVPSLYLTKHIGSTTGRMGVQKVIVAAFLKQYALVNGMECPRGRGSQEYAPLRLLPSDTSKVHMHSEYMDAWAEISSAMVSLLLTPGSQSLATSGPVSYNLFTRYWKEVMPTLRIAACGSDFCDTCTTLKNTMAAVDATDPRYDSSKQYIEKHRREAKTEFQFYKNCQKTAALPGNTSNIHLVFDFAEKVLLPRLAKQPGQLHFITGLKFDIFGVSCSNLTNNFVFELPEGHWPQEKPQMLSFRCYITFYL